MVRQWKNWFAEISERCRKPAWPHLTCVNGMTKMAHPVKALDQLSCPSADIKNVLSAGSARSRCSHLGGE